jgi:aspartyl-tRNA(Asn)/glutamyl-tRNA(Gln) amidotransferase subunit A
MTDTPALLSASALAAAFRKRRLSPYEVAEAVFARIERLDPKVNAFCHLDRAGALEQALAAEQRWRRGEPLSPIDGVPATVKDLILARGWPTLRGSKAIRRDQAWPDDAPTVARLREAGAVLIGKTTTPEFGWKGVTDSPLTGITRNPWDLGRTPGGSSGGAAVAAALGLGALHLGTDGGGSIRIPSAFTGIFGLKASFGRVPAWPPSPFAAVAHTGPMTRTVTDAALMLSVIARPDRRDPWSLPYENRDYTVGIESGIAGWRIGYLATIGGQPVHAGVAARIEAAAFRLEELGARVEPVTLDLPGAADAFKLFWCAAAATLIANFSETQRAGLDPGLLASAEDGARYSAVEYLQAVKTREAVTWAVDDLFDRCDLLIGPTLPLTAFEAGTDAPADGPYSGWKKWTPFTYPFNLSRHPAASIPCGLSDGLPVGLQMIGPSFREDVVLTAARAYEAAAPWPLPAPAAEG